MRRRTRVAIAVAAVWSAGVVVHGGGGTSAATPALPARCADPGARDASLFLVGDAGAPRTPEPLLEALVAEAREAVAERGAERIAIAFLGDNVYPVGLRAADHPERGQDERRLDAQLDVVRRSGARGVFVPGNHDWSNGAADGWEAVKRQTRYVAARGAKVLPPLGCPGPATVPLGARLALVAVDTQWWLHAHAKPGAPAAEGDAAGGCAAAEVGAVEAALAAALRDTGGRHAIVLGHHPLASGGPHGARFGWQEHLFPLREVDRRAWLPLPVLGSVWPLLRIYGQSDQDIPGARHRALAASLGRAFAASPPLVYAAGHDHSLQLLRAGPARFQVVSGAGSAPNLTWAYAVEGSLYHAARSGWFRLDAYESGAVEIAARALEGARAADAYRACLGEGPRRP